MSREETARPSVSPDPMKGKTSKPSLRTDRSEKGVDSRISPDHGNTPKRTNEGKIKYVCKIQIVRPVEQRQMINTKLQWNQERPHPLDHWKIRFIHRNGKDENPHDVNRTIHKEGLRQKNLSLKKTSVDQTPPSVARRDS